MVVLNVLIVVVAVLLTAMAASTLRWMMHAWHRPEAYESIGADVTTPPPGTPLTFSLIVPCRDEPITVMRETVRRLLAQDRSGIQVVISVGDDDRETVAHAFLLAQEFTGVVVSVNRDAVKNKPRQLNTALRDCTGDVVGIMDAESLAAPGLIDRVDATFRRHDADIVQGAVHLVNLRSRWFSLRNCLEYRVWFRSRLHGHAGDGFLPLGGNTVFVRRVLLEEAGGWDGDCLAEDCEIGVRLSAQGRRTVCLYAPGLVTQEETPDSVRAFIKQRTRWSLGFMQVLRKGEWRQLPTRAERVRAVWLLAQQFSCAFAGLVLPLAVTGAVVSDSPVLVVLIAFLPLAPTILTIAFENLVLSEYGTDMGVPIGFRDHLWLVASTPAYQILLALAALRAIGKYTTGDFGWEKTAHIGAHLEPDVPALALRAEGAAA
ncbi:MAG TPA: glycosyltransferase [Microlunatus sp.]